MLEHLAIIMDGNGRWAMRRGLTRSQGHLAGKKTLETTLEACLERQIKRCTVFALSSENWFRPVSEVNFLLKILEQILQQERKKLIDNRIQLRVIGRRDQLSQTLQKLISEAEAETTIPDPALHFNIALHYGGRWDITAACRDLAEQVKLGLCDLDSITERRFEQALALSNGPPVDLLIRTSGEFRISNFLLWELAYSEIFFTPVLWPDFSAEILDQALAMYQSRDRRFGLITEASESESELELELELELESSADIKQYEF